MNTLIVGYDSAWTARKSGAIVGVVCDLHGTLTEVGIPEIADFKTAQQLIFKWKSESDSNRVIVLLDQPIVVPNSKGQRPVENIVGSSVSLRFGGVQPANTTRYEMFGPNAPLWGFLSTFGGVGDPTHPIDSVHVFETYPVLVMIAFEWLLADTRPKGRLPKYNPERRKTFALTDWQFVCGKLIEFYQAKQLMQITSWLVSSSKLTKPDKHTQDCLDACICLMVALYFAEAKDCLMIGELSTGYMLVPFGQLLKDELDCRCKIIGRNTSQWIRRLTRAI